MNEKLKEFARYLSENKELADKLNSLQLTEENYKEEICKYAAENGYELKMEDFTPANCELDSEELKSVAGGGDCVCVLGGGGTADNIKGTQRDPSGINPVTVYSEYDNPACGCVMYGQGNYGSGGIRCSCMGAGAGSTDVVPGWIVTDY